MDRSLSSLRYEMASRDAITPFVCSTFKDFEKERNYLASVVFPRLQGLDALEILYHKLVHTQITAAYCKILPTLDHNG